MKLYIKLTAFFCAAAMVLLPLAETAWADKRKNTQYWPDGPQILSASGIVMEADTGTILYEKNMHDAHYPASITKILTALLAIENSSMDEVVTFSHDSVYKTEGSGIARDVGEQMTMEWCLYGMMLASSNECAYAIGEHVAGDMDTFVQMMNDRAAALGCQNTHFSNCNGLPDENHYTSAYDMALIAREAFKNETFRILCGTKTYTIPVTNKHKDEETPLCNHHQMLYPFRTRKYLYEYCLGGKTGYTTVANSTLVTYAEKDGMTLICVVLNVPGSGHYEDTRGLFDFCFDNFKKMSVKEHETSYSQQSQERKGMVGKYEPFVSLDAASSIILPITAEFKDADSEIVYNNEDENILGSILYTYAKRPVGAANLMASDAQVDVFEFQDEDDTEHVAVPNEESGQSSGEEALKIDKKTIFLVIFGIVGIIAVIFLVWKAADNFYRIKRKFKIGTREKSPYKTIKKNKMWNRHRKWF